MGTRPDYYYRQSAVIPYRRGAAGLVVLLIRSRRRRRWVVPKGVIVPNLSPAESAAKEAFEEAGIRGRVRPDPLGFYPYEKWGGICRVEVFAMEVEEELSSWPEEFRGRAWLTPTRASERVREPELKDLIKSLTSSLEMRPPGPS